ncbi:MAG: hypothetical protein COA78_01390 [Blastopirellula sp.]|nr:MAG: hypothetical protein COA78_01390 [Blastopirellula sp.]
MDIAAAKARLKTCEEELGSSALVFFSSFERDGRKLTLSITAQLRKRAIKDGIWRSKEMLTTLTNASYGFHTEASRSVSGRDGIYLLDRKFRPENEMMRKLFGRYIDKKGSGFLELAEALNQDPEALLPVRLVSHHMRLLGVLAQGKDEDHLVLVDCDRSK